MEPRDYTIKEITNVKDGQYPDSKGYECTLDSGDNVTVWSKFPVVVGKSVHGHIETKGQYKTFKFDKKQEQTPAGLTKFSDTEQFGLLHLKLDNILTQLKMIRGEKADETPF